MLDVRLDCIGPSNALTRSMANSDLSQASRKNRNRGGKVSAISSIRTIYGLKMKMDTEETQVVLTRQNSRHLSAARELIWDFQLSGSRFSYTLRVGLGTDYLCTCLHKQILSIHHPLALNDPELRKSIQAHLVLTYRTGR